MSKLNFAVALSLILSVVAFGSNALAKTATQPEQQSWLYVLGSYQNHANAVKRATDPSFAKFNPVIVKTKAKGFSWRVLAARSSSRAELRTKASAILSAGAKGIWEISLAGQTTKGAKRQKMPRGSPASAKKKADAFTPAVWHIDGGSTVAYTSGENPAFFYQAASGQPKTNGCFSIITRRIKGHSPPRGIWSYERQSANGSRCLTMYVFKQASYEVAAGDSGASDLSKAVGND